MKITILKKGYKKEIEKGVIASGSVILIEGKYNTVVDTGFVDDDKIIIKALKHYRLTPDDIHYVVNTHLHPDHAYNNYLFKNAEFIIGAGIYKNHEVKFLSEDELRNYVEDYEIIKTPGHGEMSISLLVKGKRNYAIVGDIFGSEEDVKNIFNGAKRAHSNFDILVESRRKVLEFADMIITGHTEPIEVKKQKSKIKAIIFDNGGVLVASGIFNTLKEWEKMFNIPYEKLKEIIFEKHYIDYRAIKITEKQFWTSVTKEVNTDIDWQILKTMWLSSYIPRQDTLDFVQEVKDSGYKTAYVSDSPLEFAEYIEARYGFPDLFPVSVVSCYDNCLKREIKAFRIILDRLGTKPDETVLLDDEEPNIEMAKSLGLHAIKFESAAQARKELKELGVTFDNKAIEYVKGFNKLNKNDVEIAGGKGASLGEMYNAGFPVPNGFVVTADAFRYFIDHNNLKEEIENKLNSLNVENTDKLRKTSDEIQELIKSSEMPEDLKEQIKKSYKNGFVAVRSSATAEDLPTASFAGQQATFLNIKGEDNVIKAVIDCFASLFTARAIYYREKNGFDHMKVALAAVIQKMVDSKKSGVIFSVNPITRNKDEIIIEGAFGLGESVVGGELTPDSFVVNKDNLDIKKNIAKQTWGYFREKGKTEKKQIDYGDKEVLDDNELNELAEITKKIESYYSCPQDIEWAIDDKIYIVQSRPITTLK